LSSRSRIEAIDLARGLAICLMVLSHGVNALVPFDAFTAWGQVPVHLITKFSSSLFILIFGITLGIVFVPRTQQPDWPQWRRRLLWRGLVVLLWYKVLTVVELYQLHEPEVIVDMLLYRDFPSYAEILGFYAIALLWIPWVLPGWARMPAAAQWASPLIVGAASWWLLTHAGFWGIPQLQAVLVEHPDYYTWGQLARGPLVLAGLVVGGLVRQHYSEGYSRQWLAGALGALAIVAGAAFFALVGDHDTSEALRAIARNVGKHPPQMLFMVFSVGGALAIMSVVLAGGERLAGVLRPVTVIGRDALAAFVFHLVVIFVVFRGLLGYHGTVSYQKALALTLGLMPATALFVGVLSWHRRRR
jgi:uncharacterized membrane protein